MPTTRRTSSPPSSRPRPSSSSRTEQGRSFVEVARDASTRRREHPPELEAGHRYGRRPRRSPGRGNPPALEEEQVRASARREQAARDGRPRHPEKSGGLLRQGVVSEVRLHRARHRGRWPVRTMCRVLAGLARRLPRLAGKAGEPQGRERARGPGRPAIKAVHGEVKARYGSPGIHAELVARGVPCSVNTVARLMREHRDRRQDEAEVPRHDRLGTTTARWPENVLDRQF